MPGRGSSSLLWQARISSCPEAQGLAVFSSRAVGAFGGSCGAGRTHQGSLPAGHWVADDVAVPPAQGSSSTSEVRPGSLIPALLILPGPAASLGKFLISGLSFSFGCSVYGGINDTIRRPDLVCWEEGEA